MSKARNTDRTEGYCDGLAGKRQCDRSQEYRDACDDGALDRQMLAMAQDMKLREAAILIS